MIKRAIFTLSQMVQQRDSLKRYKQNPAMQIKSVLALDPGVLKSEQGIRAMVIDFDGVLAAHGEIQSNPEFDNWLNLCIQTFGLGHVFILSNKPLESREAYFREHFPGIVFMRSKKKPYPDGLAKIIEITQLKPEELLVVDDRLLTGILAAILVKAQARYLVSPLANFSKRPFVEWFFMCLRKIEWWII